MAVMARTRDSRRDLLTATQAALAQHGANGIQLKQLCSELGLAPSLVNYHFGSADQLLAEAVVESYEQYVEQNTTSVDEAGPDPEPRLRAWIMSQFDWTRAHPGIASILNFGLSSPTVGNAIVGALAERLSAASAANLSLAARLVRDLRAGTLSQEPIDSIEIADAELTELTTLMMWTTLGVSTWAAGNHIPTRQYTTHAQQMHLAERAFDRVVELIKASAS
jgi:AcrR family transcriptional regulator